MRHLKLVWALGYFAFVLLFAEVALQGYYRFTAGAFLFERNAQPLWAPNPHSGFFNRANLAHAHRTNEFRVSYYTDGRGLRVAATRDQVALRPSSDRYRILLLGPSFAFGWGVDYEDTFAAELARDLQQRAFAGGRTIEVVNAGVNSIGVAQELPWLEAVGLEYRPDMILQFVYASMAVNTNPEGDATVNEAGYLVPRNYSLAQRAREQLKKSALVFYGWVIFTQLGADGDDDGNVIGAGRPLERQVRFDASSDAVTRSLAVYDRLRAAADRAGAELRIVYLPLSYVVHPEDVARWRHLGVRDVEGQMAFDAAYCSYLVSRGIACEDITDELLAAVNGNDRLYYWLDIHWTPLGNRIAARAVADWLRP